MSDPIWTERQWWAFGSEACCQIAGGPPDLADHAVAELERLEECWSRFRPTSELSRLNSDPAPTIEVSDTLALALERALLAWRVTEGWFDPTVIDAMEAAGYAASYPMYDIPRGHLGACRPAVGLRDVVIRPNGPTIERPPGLRFDLGGIGKGLAADLVATQLSARGATSVCLSLGGDVRVAGTAPSGGWRIPVERSDAGTDLHDGPEQWFEVLLDEGAIVQSTTAFRRWTTVDGLPAHHLIDPRSGRPSTSGVTTAVVSAAEAWWAEVLAKAALLAGPHAGRQLLDRHGATGWLSAA